MNGWKLWAEFCGIEEEANKDGYSVSVWDTIYYNDITPLSRLEKESKYFSKVLPTRDLGYSHQLPSIPDLQIDSLPI